MRDIPRGFAERIAIELAARARDGRATVDDAAVAWIERQLIAFAAAYNIHIATPD